MHWVCLSVPVVAKGSGLLQDPLLQVKWNEHSDSFREGIERIEAFAVFGQVFISESIQGII